MIRPGVREALFARAGQKPIPVKIGGEIDGWTIAAIELDRVVLANAFGSQIVRPTPGVRLTSDLPCRDLDTRRNGFHSGRDVPASILASRPAGRKMTIAAFAVLTHAACAVLHDVHILARVLCSDIAMLPSKWHRRKRGQVSTEVQQANSARVSGRITPVTGAARSVHPTRRQRQCHRKPANSELCRRQRRNLVELCRCRYSGNRSAHSRARP